MTLDRPAADAAHDEDLPNPRAAGARTRRLRIDIAVGAVVIGGAFLLARAASHGDDTPTGTTPTHAASVPTAVRTDDALRLLPARLADPEQCPPDVVCGTAPEATGPAQAAVQDALPGAVVRSARTVRVQIEGHGQALWFVALRARYGHDQVKVQVQVQSPGDRTGHSVMLFAGRSITRYEADLLKYHVIVQFIAPADEYVPLDALKHLAADVRLAMPI